MPEICALRLQHVTRGRLRIDAALYDRLYNRHPVPYADVRKSIRGKSNKNGESERPPASHGFSANAANRLALCSSGPCNVGSLSSSHAKPSWYAIARQAVAAVASSASVRSRGIRTIVALLRSSVHAVRGGVDECMSALDRAIQVVAGESTDVSVA
jgi:hypothetical protein